jgi:hypothetical protein
LPRAVIGADLGPSISSRIFKPQPLQMAELHQILIQYSAIDDKGFAG